MNTQFSKGLLLTSLGSFWWGFIGVIYFEYVSFIGHIELVVHRCLWTAVMLVFTTTFLSKWKIFFREIKIKSGFNRDNREKTKNYESLTFQHSYLVANSVGVQVVRLACVVA